MIKTVLFGYTMPIWFVLAGIISETVFGIESNPYYATVGYVMGIISAMIILFKD